MMHITYQLFYKNFWLKLWGILGNLKIGCQNQKIVFLQKNLEIQAIFL